MDVLKTQRTGGLSFCLIIIAYNCDEYCDMLLLVVARNGQVGTDARQFTVYFRARHFPETDV